MCDEFFRQGEFERKLNLPVTSICDQQLTSVAKIQSGKFLSKSHKLPDGRQSRRIFISEKVLSECVQAVKPTQCVT